MAPGRPVRPVRPTVEKRVENAPEQPEKTPEKAPECNVPGCSAEPEFRGLCPAHRQTHRGLFDPVSKEATRRD